MNSSISIIIITHNRAGFISEAIESALGQSFSDRELIIIDDASSYNTREIVESYASEDERIKYFKNNEHLHISKSRNKGLSLASGKYIAILDSDDVWCDKDKLKKQYQFLEKHNDYALVGGGVIVIDEKGKEIKRYLNPYADDKIRKQILVKNPFAHSSVMYVRDFIKEIGGYNEDLSGIEDYDLWLRIGIEWKFFNLNDYVLKYRVHGSNISVLERLRLMQSNLFLINKYNKNYPNFYFAWIRRSARLVLFKIFNFIKK